MHACPFLLEVENLLRHRDRKWKQLFFREPKSAPVLQQMVSVVGGVESHGVLWLGLGRDSLHRLGCAARRMLGRWG